MSYQHIDVKPISGALGAEIYGADLATLTDDVFTEIHDAFLEHQVIFFRVHQQVLEYIFGSPLL